MRLSNLGVRLPKRGERTMQVPQRCLGRRGVPRSTNSWALGILPGEAPEKSKSARDKMTSPKRANRPWFIPCVIGIARSIIIYGSRIVSLEDAVESSRQSHRSTKVEITMLDDTKSSAVLKIGRICFLRPAFATYAWDREKVYFGCS